MTITDDVILNGRVRLRQTSDGYRAGMDAALLAAACDAPPRSRVLDAGCGPGAVMLAAAVRRPQAQFVGLDIDEAALDLARENIALNRLGERISVQRGDVNGRFSALGLPLFDAVLSNPPFFDDPSALRGPAPARTKAWITPEGLERWIAFLVKAVRDGGTITLIHRADRLDDVLGALSHRAGSFRIRPVQPFAGTPAKRVLVRAVRSGKAPLVLLPPVTLHERGGAKHTPEAEAILRGEADLGWS